MPNLGNNTYVAAKSLLRLLLRRGYVAVTFLLRNDNVAWSNAYFTQLKYACADFLSFLSLSYV